eukprot:361235-Chlamydomonas_euryale.AAC.5
MAEAACPQLQTATLHCSTNYDGGVKTVEQISSEELSTEQTDTSMPGVGDFFQRLSLRAAAADSPAALPQLLLAAGSVPGLRSTVNKELLSDGAAARAAGKKAGAARDGPWSHGDVRPPAQLLGHGAAQSAREASANDDGATDAAVSTSGASTMELPTSLFFSYPVCSGPRPPPRWAHSAVLLGRHMLVYGGMGHGAHEDLWLLDTETLTWRSVKPSASTAKDRPGTVLAHAAAGVGNKMWMFGGQHGRSFIATLYMLDLETCSWHLIRGKDQPSARAGHAMATVGSDVYLFGGESPCMGN